jgi:hypothetical protein
MIPSTIKYDSIGYKASNNLLEVVVAARRVHVVLLAWRMWPSLLGAERAKGESAVRR